MSKQRLQLIKTPVLIEAIKHAFKMLSPAVQFKNPVMFVVEVGSVLTTIAFISDCVQGRRHEALFSGQITLWLWFTVLFANFAEAMAEGRGKAQAENLKKARTETMANRRTQNGKTESVPSSVLRKGDVVIVSAGQAIPADGTVIDGVAPIPSCFTNHRSRFSCDC